MPAPQDLRKLRRVERQWIDIVFATLCAEVKQVDSGSF